MRTRSGELMTVVATSDLLRQSRDSIARGSKSFSAAAQLFPSEIRSDAIMLYAWCRYADDLIDGQIAGHDQRSDFRQGQRERLEDLRRRTKAVLNGDPDCGSAFDALRVVVQKHQLPHRHPMELIDGFEMDVEERAYHQLDETLDYCYHVAGVVGVMMSMIMGARDERTLDRASDLGIAFQLTNIARDVIDDAKAGRTYVPLSWLEESGLSDVDPADRHQWPKLHVLAVRLLDVAEPHYQSAYRGLSELPWRSAWAIAAARRVYRDIGTKLRREGPEAWENRVSTSKARKTWLLFLSLKDVAATRFANSGDGSDRTGLYERPKS